MKKFNSVEDFFAESSKWEGLLEKLREIVLSTGLSECMKWQMPCYTDRNKNIVSVYATKDFVGLWFFQGALLADAHQLLTNAQEGKTKAMRRMKFTELEEIDASIIGEYIFEAIENQRAGRVIKPDRTVKKEIVIPDELQEAFADNESLKIFYEKLTYGKKKEFAEYIGEAKREETRKRRLEKSIPLILKGIGVYDKYK